VRSLQWKGERGPCRLSKVHQLGEDRRVVGENKMPFGLLRVGFAADFIATRVNISENFEDEVDSKNIVFIMKCGRIYKHLQESMKFVSLETFNIYLSSW
jgi:hypothetical protein